MQGSLVESVALFEVLLLGWIDKNDGLATLDHIHSSSLTDSAFQTERHLFSGFGFLVENGLGLTTKTGLFHVVSSST
jgi:hypothetical protein